VSGYPVELPLSLDRRTRWLSDGRTLLGGNPPRMLTLSRSGRRAVEVLERAGAGARDEVRELARRLVDTELAHPTPAHQDEADIPITVVIPVHGRPRELDRCLSALNRSAIVVDDGSPERDAIAAVCAGHATRLIRRELGGGPAAARNTGASCSDGQLIAFLDSDCVPTAGWIGAVVGHFQDPRVAAVAPRVSPLATGPGPLARYAAARSPLDMGPDPAQVGPGRRVSYVPSAALVIRRSALGAGFDETLRYGEDVDLVWRLVAGGWQVRYEPRAVVLHEEPNGLRGLLHRRHRYGTAAAPLAKRHPGQLAPAVLDARSSLVAGLLLGGHRNLAAGAFVWQAVPTVRFVPGGRLPARIGWLAAARATLDSLTAAGRLATTLAPLAVGLAAAGRSGRRGLGIALVVTPLRDWSGSRPRLDPARWTCLYLLDDLAYGLGLWRGAVRARSLEPLRPARRSRNNDKNAHKSSGRWR
jgi:mycofactocin system glycosyltransferase